MRDLLTKINTIGLGLSVTLGLVGWWISDALVLSYTKIEYIGLIGLLFMVYCLSAERLALSHLDRKHPIRIHGNPFIKRFILQFVMLIIGGFIVYNSLSLNSMLDFMLSAILTYFFVSAFFETIRFLRIGK